MARSTGALMISRVGMASAFATMTANGRSPHFGSGTAITEASATPSAVATNSSSWMESTHSPPVLTMRSEEHTSELQSLMRISYAVFCLKKKKNNNSQTKYQQVH